MPFDNTGTGLAAADTQAAIAELAAGGLVDTDDQDLSLSGTTLQITDGASVDLSTIIPPGGTDDQEASEVPFDNTGTGLAAADTQAAIAELAAGGLVDTDDQGLSLSGTMLQIDDGTGVDLAPLISSSGHDNQRLDFNESTGTLKIENGNIVNLSSLTDADSDPENEIDVTRKHGLLVGDDGIIDGLIGTADGQVAKWDAALGNWVAGTDEVGGGSGSSVWGDITDGINYNDGNVSIGQNSPGHLPDASQYFTVSGGVTDGDFGAIEIKGRQNTIGMPIGRFGFLSLSNIGSTFEIARIEARISDGAQFRGDLGFFTMNGSDGTDASLQERMTIKRTGNVGIGVINPTSKLEVDGIIRSTTLMGSGDRNVVADVDGNLKIGAIGGSSLWMVNDDGIYFDGGYVGIGIDNPVTNLDIFSRRSNPLSLETFASQNWISYNNSNGYIGYTGIFNGANDMDFGTGVLNTIGKVHLVTGASPKLTLIPNGNVGIGTINPTANLHLIGNSNLNKPLLKLEEEGNDYARLEFKNTESDAFWHVAGVGEDGFGSGQNSKINFYFKNDQGAGNRMTITGDGRVGVNTSNPSARLTIYQDGQDVGNGLSFSDGGPNDDWHITHGYGLRFHYGSTLKALINASTGAFTVSSDRRLKKDIEPLPSVLDKVSLLKPSTYVYKSDTTKTKTLGLIAQDVQPLFPELVSKSDGDGMLGVNYSGFSVVALRAIQEQQFIIEEQSEKISNLEERLRRLEARIGK
ncbi:MAG: tail fiber domain-containing protein [Nonlabens ulvanivorans]